MTFHTQILTLYPEMFPGPLGLSLAGRALSQGIWSCDPIQIRDFATDKHRTVDDTPAGGGAGMVLRCDVLSAVVDEAERRMAERSKPHPNPSPEGEGLLKAAPTARETHYAGAHPRDRLRPRRDHSLRAFRGVRRAPVRRSPADRTGQPHRYHPLRRRDGGAHHPRRLHSAASRRNGRAFERSRGASKAAFSNIRTIPAR
jgi:hypothetical protein